MAAGNEGLGAALFYGLLKHAAGAGMTGACLVGTGRRAPHDTFSAEGHCRDCDGEMAHF